MSILKTFCLWSLAAYGSDLDDCKKLAFGFITLNHFILSLEKLIIYAGHHIIFLGDEHSFWLSHGTIGVHNHGDVMSRWRC
jgi:hypothetical protein